MDFRQIRARVLCFLYFKYVYSLHGISPARRGGLDPARFSTPLTEAPLYIMIVQQGCPIEAKSLLTLGTSIDTVDRKA